MRALRGSKATSLVVLSRGWCMFLTKSRLNQIWFLSDQPTLLSAVYHDLPTVWHRDLCLLVWHQSLSPVCTIQTEHTSHISLCLVSFMSDRATHLRLFDRQVSGHCMKQSPGSLLSIWNLMLTNRHRHNRQSSLHLLNFVNLNIERESTWHFLFMGNFM